MNSLLGALGEHSLAIAFVNVLLVQLGLPVPAYPALVVTGALIAQRGGSIAALLAVAVLASVIADLAWYAAGRRYGGRVVRAVCRISLAPDSCVRQTESLFARWGAASLLVAKFVPGFATIATAVAGNSRLSITVFVALDAVGAALYAAVPILLGVVFRDAVGSILAVLEAAGRWGITALAAALLLFIAYRWWQRHSLIRELRMTRISVPELAELIAGERRTDDPRRALGRQPRARRHDPGRHRLVGRRRRRCRRLRSRGRDRRLLRLPERGLGGARRAGAARRRLSPRPAAARRPQRLDRCRPADRGGADERARRAGLRLQGAAQKSPGHAGPTRQDTARCPRFALRRRLAAARPVPP